MNILIVILAIIINNDIVRLPVFQFKAKIDTASQVLGILKPNKVIVDKCSNMILVSLPLSLSSPPLSPPLSPLLPFLSSSPPPSPPLPSALLYPPPSLLFRLPRSTTNVSTHQSLLCLLGKAKTKEARQTIINPEWNFEKMGIGGLDREFSDIFRRAFASRVFPPDIVEQMGEGLVVGECPEGLGHQDT